MKRNIFVRIFTILVLIPSVCSTLSALTGNILLFILALIIALLVIAKLPCCRKCETIWVFVMTILIFVPMNIRAYIVHIYPDLIYNEHSLIYYWLVGIEIVFFMLCIETSVCCILSALIWKKQCSLEKLIE